MAPRAETSRLVVTVLTSALAIAACATRSDRAAPEGERTARAHQDLTASQLFGASLPAKTVALTFDDGPGARTAELSAYLAQENIRATFFVNGARIAATALPSPNIDQPTPGAAATLQRLAADGHLLANHTTTHRNLTQTDVDHPEFVPATERVQELAETDALISPYVPANRFLFRAPYGNWNPAVFGTLSASAMNKYVGPIYWEIGGDSNGYPARAADWWCWNTSKTTEQCGDAYLAEIDTRGRGIVLMHDPYGWAQGSTVDMVKYMVPLLKAQGYAFVRLDQVPAIASALPCDASCATCAGPEADQCTSCGAGRYLAAGQCLPCDACAAGTYQAAACAASANTVCTACHASCATCTGPTDAECTTCKAGTFLNGAQCTACSACAAGTYASAACTAATDTICTACHASCATCAGPGADDCGACPAGAYLADGACKACTACAPGTYQAAACAATSDAVCTACAPGTWAPAGAAACAACGSCDDGDPCTSDACDATEGCVHAPVAGCSPDAGAAPPAPTSPAAPPAPTGPGADTGAAGPVTIAGDDGSGDGCSVGGPRSGGRRDGALVLVALGGVLAVARRRLPPRDTPRGAALRGR